MCANIILRSQLQYRNYLRRSLRLLTSLLRNYYHSLLSLRSLSNLHRLFMCYSFLSFQASKSNSKKHLRKRLRSSIMLLAIARQNKYFFSSFSRLILYLLHYLSHHVRKHLQKNFSKQQLSH